MDLQDDRCCAGARSPLDASEAEDFAGAFALLADPTRLRLVSLISAGHCRPVAAGDLVSPLGVNQPTVSHHLSKLTAAGLLRREQVGRAALFTLDHEAFARLREVIHFG